MCFVWKRQTREFRELGPLNFGKNSEIFFKIHVLTALREIGQENFTVLSSLVF